MIDGLNEILRERILKGDPRCKIPIGAAIEKVWCDKGGDRHPVGSKGKVIGSLYTADMEMPELYYVAWHDSEDREDKKTFVIAAKIKRIKG